MVMVAGNRRSRHPCVALGAFAFAKAMIGPCPRLMTPKLSAKITRSRKLAVRTSRISAI